MGGVSCFGGHHHWQEIGDLVGQLSGPLISPSIGAAKRVYRPLIASMMAVATSLPSVVRERYLTRRSWGSVV